MLGHNNYNQPHPLQLTGIGMLRGRAKFPKVARNYVLLVKTVLFKPNPASKQHFFSHSSAFPAWINVKFFARIAKSTMRWQQLTPPSADRQRTRNSEIHWQPWMQPAGSATPSKAEIYSALAAGGRTAKLALCSRRRQRHRRRYQRGNA